mmetsp:Transcript_101074/g.195548  ORF Transcript_101074/g.195548 Transcript_101074/m.195548 type:complete len:227 (-) Transcript_101074:1125-1805(-)
MLWTLASPLEPFRFQWVPVPRQVPAVVVVNLEAAPAHCRLMRFGNVYLAMLPLLVLLLLELMLLRLLPHWGVAFQCVAVPLLAGIPVEVPVGASQCNTHGCPRSSLRHAQPGHLLLLSANVTNRVVVESYLATRHVGCGPIFRRSRPPGQTTSLPLHRNHPSNKEPPPVLMALSCHRVVGHDAYPSQRKCHKWSRGLKRPDHALEARQVPLARVPLTMFVTHHVPR